MPTVLRASARAMRALHYEDSNKEEDVEDSDKEEDIDRNGEEEEEEGDGTAF